MYLLLLTYFLFPSYENCPGLVSKTDQFDYESTEDIKISRNGDQMIYLHLLLSRKSLFMNFKVVGGGKCIDDNEEMTVIFTDRSGLTMINDNNFNCDGIYTQHFGEDFGKKKELKKFLTKEIQSIRITTDGIPVEVNLAPTERIKIYQTLNCLAEKM